ncbi:PREDICTED: sphingosine-1-phosphate lyase-like [Branchiostoma belcheri]|uniref:sphinganine-1-phosphate aldolase n=1 Tax=Branchiostoma belcheri TaxID=7741 RepID=A0A6P4Y0N6_BRABE|nr:PREDICTED: sphingosine-1-phosphate lyase-like [Branchiostoma belcheri]
MEWLYWVEHAVMSLLLAALVRLAMTEGWQGVLRAVLVVLRYIPGVGEVINWVIRRMAVQFAPQLTGAQQDGSKKDRKPPRVVLPKKGQSYDAIVQEMKKLQKEKDTDPHAGKMFAYVYTLEDDASKVQKEAVDMFMEQTGLGDDHDRFVREIYQSFIHTNVLNPFVFPALRRFEIETVSMVASFLHGDDQVVGSLTSGGTESILMAVKSYRDRARKLFPQITQPEMVAPITIHPAFEKAASYFCVKMVHVPVGPDFRADVKAMEQAITGNTILLCASAPQYCHGIVDPIPDVSALALRRKLPLHVDACFGGFMLPWVEKLGYPVPTFDFRNPGVTSISADIHKYGYGVKGASVILYKSTDFWRYQLFSYSGWPGGIFGSCSMAGSRPGGNIAAAWAVLKAMGEDGYMKTAQEVMETTEFMINNIRNIPGLCILGEPHMTAFAIGSRGVNILALADEMESKGWRMERTQNPNGIHCSIMPSHTKVREKFIEDLTAAAEYVKIHNKSSEEGASMAYGLAGQVPDKALVDDFIKEIYMEFYTKC